MLDLMRKKAGSWMIKFILGAIIVVFAFWGVGTYNASRLVTVATVDDQVITYETYRDTYARLMEEVRERFGGNLDDNLLKAMDLQQLALDQLINDQLLINEARRLGLAVTDEELARAIRQVQAFQNQNGFDPDRYQRVLSANRMTPENFEQNQRQAMLIGKLRALVTDPVKVPEVEARQWYDFANAKVAVDFVRIDSQQFKDAAVTDEEVQAYYETHKEAYRIEAMRRSRYLAFLPDAFKDQVVVSDDEVAEFYAANREMFHQAENVEASHVLIRTAETDSPEAVEAARQRAADVAQKAREGADFAELAREYSEGPAAAAGGSLGRFGRDQMIKPFADQAFSMEAGEISDPVKTEFGWHVIRLDQAYPEVTRPLEEVQDEIRAQIVARKARILAFEAADSAWDAAYDEGGLEAVAKARQLPLGETGLFARGDGPEKTPVKEPQKFAAAAFELGVGEISDVQEMSDGYYLIEVTEEKPARVPELAEVAEVVRADALAAKHSDLGRQEAETLLKAGRDGETLASLAAARGLTVQKTDLFGRQEPIPAIGASRQMSEAVFGLSEASPWPEEVFNVNQAWYVVRLAERQAPEAAGFEAQKQQIVGQLRQQQQAEAFEALLAQLRQRSKIEINAEVLAL
jgi:peptidyl-prolyl cis-trans isomerase D